MSMLQPDEFYYEVFVAGVSKAFCRSWDAKQAVLRLICGTSLMLPPDVRVVLTRKES